MINKNKDLIFVLFFSALVLITRIYNLTGIPIFTDEAIYIRWAQIGLADPVHRYISLTDGKQPLLTWLMYPLLLVFEDPLVAGRLVSVAAGVFSVIGIYLLTNTLFIRKTAIIASLLYIFSPFALVYDKLALMDSLLATFAIWSLYLQVLQVKYLRLDISLLLGATVGLGLMTKSSAMFFLYLLPFGLLLFRLKGKDNRIRLFRWILYSVLSSIIALIMYNSLRLSPMFYIIEQKNYSFILTFSEFLRSPFKLFLPNLNGLSTFLRDYFTIPVLILALANVIYSIVKFRLKILVLFAWFIVPFLALAAFGKILFPRFILFMSLPLLLISAEFISMLLDNARRKKNYIFALIAISLIFPVYNSLTLLINPVKANIPEIDRNQLFNDWPSGYGVKEVVHYIEKQATGQTVVIGTEGTFGLNPAVYEIYLKQNKNVIILGFWPVSEVPVELLSYAKDHPTFLVFKDRQTFPPEWPLELVAKYQRGTGKTYLYFFRVLPENEKY